MRPRFLLDEHLDRAIQRQLQRQDPQVDVLLVGDVQAPPKGLLDPDLLFWIEEHGYLLVTNNRGSMPQHLEDHYQQGRHIPGVFWLRPSASLGSVIEELFLIWSVSDASEYVDRLLYIPL